jgi:hypothetical protein
LSKSKFLETLWQFRGKWDYFMPKSGRRQSTDNLTKEVANELDLKRQMELRGKQRENDATTQGKA